MAYHYSVDLPEIDSSTWRKEVRAFKDEWQSRLSAEGVRDVDLCRTETGCLLNLKYQEPDQSRATVEVHTAYRDPRRKGADYLAKIKIPNLSEPVSRLIKLFAYKKCQWSDSELYKHAGVGKTTYHAFMSPYVSEKVKGGTRKVRTNTRIPQKKTLVQLAVAMQLEVDEVEVLFLHAGYAFSPSIRWDVILKVCFKDRIWNILDINELLDREGCEELLDMPNV